MSKTALITGVTGQDGSYLAELLLEKGYDVHGMVRRSSTERRDRIDHLNDNPNFHLHYGDLADSLSLVKIIGSVKPDEIYNLAAQSHVGVSFDVPEYTADVVATGVLRVLEAVRVCGLGRPAVSTRRPHRSCTARWRRFRSVRQPRFIRTVRTQWQSSTVSGS